jgi:hypothetical protein
VALRPHDSLPATEAVTYAIHDGRETSGDRCVPLIRSAQRWFRDGTDWERGVPATMHSRQSAIAPIIPMIHSPMQARMPARQEMMHPISAREKKT